MTTETNKKPTLRKQETGLVLVAGVEVQNSIHLIRGRRVMLDADLAHY